MPIYLTQHGLAMSKEQNPDRPLSEQGRRDIGALAEFLRNAGAPIGQVVHSGKTRAEQTAAILAEAIPAAGQPQARAGLDPNDPVEALLTEISTWSADNTLIVGHLPFIGRLASLLLCSNADQPVLAFQPGSMACLEKGTDGNWVLAWMVRPELFAQ